MKIISNFLQIIQKNKIRKDIKFVIIHYTGMQSEIESIEGLRIESSK